MDLTITIYTGVILGLSIYQHGPAEGVVAHWTNPLTRASGLDYVFSTSAFQALALKPPTSTVPSSQLWAVGNEKTGGKPQFWDISLEGCCLQKKSENEKQNYQENCLLRKFPIMSQICFSMLIIQK